MATGKITIKGYEASDTQHEHIKTIATLNSIPTEKLMPYVSGETSDEKTAYLISVFQHVSSAYVDRAVIQIEPEYERGETDLPRNELESSEIYSENFSDTTVVPTLQMVLSNGDIRKTVSVKYMGDPIEGPRNVRDSDIDALAEEIEEMYSLSFVQANLVFNGKDDNYFDVGD